MSIFFVSIDKQVFYFNSVPLSMLYFSVLHLYDMLAFILGDIKTTVHSRQVCIFLLFPAVTVTFKEFNDVF